MTVADGDVGGPGPGPGPPGRGQATPAQNENPAPGAAGKTINYSEMTFEKYKEINPNQAEVFLGQLREVSGKSLASSHLFRNQ
jgi:hypothetical protein